MKGGGSYFPRNIKTPYRQAFKLPSRRAAWTCCFGECSFPSPSFREHICFQFSYLDSWKKKRKKKSELSDLWYQHAFSQSVFMIVTKLIFPREVIKRDLESFSPLPCRKITVILTSKIFSAKLGKKITDFFLGILKLYHRHQETLCSFWELKSTIRGLAAPKWHVLPSSSSALWIHDSWSSKSTCPLSSTLRIRHNCMMKTRQCDPVGDTRGRTFVSRLYQRTPQAGGATLHRL